MTVLNSDNTVIETITERLKRFKLIQPSDPVHESYQPSAVLIALIFSEQQWNIVITRRAKHLKHHPGQNSFPGGKWSPQDPSLIQTAIREAEEEIGLPAESVEILGTFPGHRTSSGFYITPIVAKCNYNGCWKVDHNEVDSVFNFPLTCALDENMWRMENTLWKGIKRTYPVCWWNNHLIWGATAELLSNFRKALMIHHG